MFFCRTVALFFHKWISRHSDKKCVGYCSSWPRIEQKCIFLRKQKAVNTCNYVSTAFFAAFSYFKNTHFFVVEAMQQSANLQFLHRHCLLSPIFSKNSIAHFLSIVNNKKPAVQNRKSSAVLPVFLLVIYLYCRQTSRKLSTLTYPVTYFPAGVLPQYALRVVIRKRPSLHCLPS